MRNPINIYAEPDWGLKEILDIVKEQASEDGYAYDIETSGIGHYEYWGAKCYQKPERFIVPRWSDVVVFGINEKTLLSINDYYRFKVVVDEMEASIDCNVEFDEDSSKAEFRFSNAD